MKPHVIYGLLTMAQKSASKIAKDLGVTRNYVGKVINRERGSELVETAIAEAIGKTREEVFGDEPVKPKDKEAA